MKTDSKFKKGQSGNPQGRPKGIPNRATKELKEAISVIIDAEFEQLDDHLDQLTARERLEFLTRLLPYVIPKHKEQVIKHSLTIPEIPNMPDIGNRK